MTNHILRDFRVRPGGHCESSAMQNALAFLGYETTEADIIGGGAAPSFLFTTQGFPFLGGRSPNMREFFFKAAKIDYEVVVPRDASSGWEAPRRALASGLPVLLRVDMRYLPYLFGGSYGPPHFSFGWHWVCLVGIDSAGEEAFVTDTALESIQSIRIADLDKARSSQTKVFPPNREYVVIAARPKDWHLDTDALFHASLGGLRANYETTTAWRDDAENHDEKTLIGLTGLEALPKVLAEIETYTNQYTLVPAYRFMSDSIERNGTGGAAFRRLYRAFLLARGRDCTRTAYQVAVQRLLAPTEDSMRAWSELARVFEEAAQGIKQAKGASAKREARTLARNQSVEAAEKLVRAEASLYGALCTILSSTPYAGGDTL